MRKIYEKYLQLLLVSKSSVLKVEGIVISVRHPFKWISKSLGFTCLKYKISPVFIQFNNMTCYKETSKEVIEHKWHHFRKRGNNNNSNKGTLNKTRFPQIMCSLLL